MKKTILMLSVLAISLGSYAQLKTPQPSPMAKIEQVVGLTDITIAYSRPGMKGRTIFGDLVPYDKLWRTGANENTTITFSEDVKVEGKAVKKGTYALFTKPGKTSWEIYLYTDAENWGVPKVWDETKVALQVMVKPIEIPVKIESFLMVFDMLKNGSAELELLWDNVYVPIKIEVPTATMTMANIKETLGGAEPKANDYYSAASYYFEEGKDLNEALTWIDKALALHGEDAFWMLRKKSLIEAKLGKTDAAIATAKRALAAAEKAGNESYIKMNKASLKEWGSS